MSVIQYWTSSRRYSLEKKKDIHWNTRCQVQGHSQLGTHDEGGSGRLTLAGARGKDLFLEYSTPELRVVLSQLLQTFFLLLLIFCMENLEIHRSLCGLKAWWRVLLPGPQPLIPLQILFLPRPVFLLPAPLGSLWLPLLTVRGSLLRILVAKASCKLISVYGLHQLPFTESNCEDNTSPPTGFE